MKIAGIVAEYNPFHNGHAYLLSRARGLGATHVAAVLSGSAPQRGEVGILSKWARAEMALRCGADLVLELSAPYASASAEQFALGGVSILAALGCVDLLVFGSESGDLTALRRTLAATERPGYLDALRSARRTGLSHARAAGALLPEAPHPNDLLGVEYLRALKRLGSAIEPVAVPRVGGPHDSAEAEGLYCSASALRAMALAGDLAGVAAFMPPEAHDVLLREHAAERFPADMRRAFPAVLFALRSLPPDLWPRIQGIAEGLEYRIQKAAQAATSLDELYSAVKTKRYTLARVRRAVTAAVLRITDEATEGFEFSGDQAAAGGSCTLLTDSPAADETMPSPAKHKPLPAPYIRILGMGPRGADILAAAKPTLPLSSSAREIIERGGRAARVIEAEIRAGDLFALCCPQLQPAGDDYTHKLVTL